MYWRKWKEAKNKKNQTNTNRMLIKKVKAKISRLPSNIKNAGHVIDWKNKIMDKEQNYSKCKFRERV